MMRSIKFNWVLLIVLITLFIVACNKKVAVDDKPCTTRTDRIVLVSPNGLHKITLQATDSGAGIWITGEPNKPFVSLYEGLGQNQAALGLAGDYSQKGRTFIGYDAALGVIGGAPAQLQLVDQENKMHFLSGKELK